MLLNELVLEPKDTGYSAVFLARGEYRIEVWSDVARTDYDLIVAPLDPPWNSGSFDDLETHTDLDPLVAQCVFYELLKKYPEK